MDSKTLRTTLSVLHEELANLRANQENVAETMALQQREIDCQRQELNERQADMDRQQRDTTAALEASIQLARGQPAPTSQPDQPPRVPPQQDPNSSHPSQPASPPRPKQPPAAQQDIPFQDPEQHPPSRAGRDNPHHQRQNRVGQPPRSPKCQTAEEPNPPSRGHSAGAKIVGDEGKMMALTARVRRHSPLWSSLRKNGVKSTQELLDRADRYIKLEEAIANDGKSPAKDKGQKEDPVKSSNGSDKPNGNSKSNWKNGEQRAVNV
ncbi:uncharacterized protein LOC133806682 [Humulus lupulus]|uniref:uncharacterized protein LOC133806682 n=1 Tax=Humulus lupulus TaxID=3486 RepID=UPI002B416538|nr:uncharacterized protein LOC133806682 [Humulus lupulus]